MYKSICTIEICIIIVIITNTRLKKKLKKLKIVKLKRFKPNVFSTFLHLNSDDGKQPKTFGLNLFNFSIFNFFFSLVLEIHFIERALWTLLLLLSLLFTVFPGKTS